MSVHQNDTYVRATNKAIDQLPSDESLGELEPVAYFNDAMPTGHDPRLLWPDTLSLAADGYLYVTANQLHRQARYNKGNDLRRKPYTLFRVRTDAQPVLLR
jgi:hypothetical protein